MSRETLAKARREWGEWFKDMPAPETLRDHFAMAALTGLLTRQSDVGMSRETYAEVAYKYADAMMEARK